MVKSVPEEYRATLVTLTTAALPPMAQRIADALAEEIVAGRHRPGGPLREQELAARFKISRGPVREALRILERERLVEVFPWRGARVALLSLAELANVFELQEALFALVARLCAVHGDEDAFAQIQALVGQMETAVGHGIPPEDHGARIAERMMAMCGNDRAADVLRQLERQTRWRYAHLDGSDELRGRWIVSSWRGMAGALSARDAETAESIAKRMIRHHRDMVLSALEAEESAGRMATDRRRKRRTGNK